MCLYLYFCKLLVENYDIFIPHLCLAAPQGVTPLEFREEWAIVYKSMTICSAVLIQYQRRRTDRQTDVQPIAKMYFSIADARKNDNEHYSFKKLKAHFYREAFLAK